MQVVVFKVNNLDLDLPLKYMQLNITTRASVANFSEKPS